MFINSILRPFFSIKNRVSNIRISTKITVYFSLLLIVTVIMGAFLYQKVYLNIISNKVEELSKQVLDLYRYNIDSTIDNFINFSIDAEKNENVQNLLKNERRDNQSENDVYSYLAKLLSENESVQSVFLLDYNGTAKCMVNRRPISELGLRDVKSSGWYKEWYKLDIRAKQKYIISLNPEDIFLKKPDYNLISLIRIIYNQDKKQIGILIICVSDMVFKGYYNEFTNSSDEGIILLDGKNNYIPLNKIKLNAEQFINRIKQNKVLTTETIDNKKYVFASMDINRYDMKLISSMSLEKVSNEFKAFSFVSFILITIYCILVFIGSILISRTITKPLEMLVSSMKNVENKQFTTVNIKPNENNEISKLKRVYNIMIIQIQKLLHLEKQKAELDILQMQIKPHFLYNTIDAIRYLSLAGENKKVNEALEALGSYYRTSLSKGKEVITIGEEISIVKDYLTLIKLRCGEIFNVNYDVDENANQHKILKLVLQPLVENAIFHGIQPTGETGNINISVKSNNAAGNIIITIEDDGVGISADRLKYLTNDCIDDNSSSFGLKGTIKRLQIFYGISDMYSIESQKGFGARITLKIPIERE
ncbi:MAG: histidine kinase [Bacillota bacterium]|nr:histidine kinase [Bacillota bacterium]